MSWRYHDVIMTVGGEDERKKNGAGKMNLRKVLMKHGCLVVFIRHDPAEILGV